MAKKKILFICTGNSARSQMAEGFARYYGGDLVSVSSAGTRPQGLNPNAIWAMNEVSIDISHQTSDSIPDDLATHDHIVTLCGDARDNCPRLPSSAEVEHWALPDPAGTRGQALEVLEAFRVIRNQIETNVRTLLDKAVG